MWQPLDGDDRTEMMHVPGGVLYRTSWRMSHGIGAAVQDCCGVVFVPADPTPVVTAEVQATPPEAAPTPQEEHHEEAVAA